MNPQSFDEEAVFNEARRIEDHQARAAYLHQACPDESSFARIDALLRMHAHDDSFLNAPPDIGAATEIKEQFAERPGTEIGPYKLLEQIGEGGFGVVFMAEQTSPVRRKVALKVIKPGMDSKQVVARFEAERQALALMDHPHIARVLDGGSTESGRPFFVMELVRGVPITSYCDGHQLAVAERLELFVDVCRAIQHAHQKGIIHRDLKPSNILVTLHDGRPVVKVIDFGVAKATGQQLLTNRTLFTGFAQMVGTPLYMSPEQAELSGLDIDTRSDIYSLGVLLYELLTGTTPFDKERLSHAAFDEIRRIIREEDPPRPSTRLSSCTDTLPSISAQRKVDPHKLSQLLQGDLDWIVMQAMEKDRNRRYETANGLVRDIERYLKDEPIEARPPSAVYRFRKLIRRNKWTIAAGSLISTCVVVLAVGAFIYARQQHDLAVARKDLADDRETARQEADQLRHETEAKLYRSLLNESRALRTARVPGFRAQAWKNLRAANELKIPGTDPEEIKLELLACLGNPLGMDVIRFPQAERITRPPVPEDFHGLVPTVTQAPRQRFALSSSGEWLAIYGRPKGYVTLYDRSRDVISQVIPKLNVVYDMEISPDNALLVMGCIHGTEIRNLPDLSMYATFPGTDVIDVSVHPSGRLLACLDHSSQVEIFSLSSNRVTARLETNKNDHIEFSRDGSLLLGIKHENDSVYKGWPITSTPEKQNLYGHREFVKQVEFSPDGQRVASASKDGLVYVWDVATGKRLFACQGHRQEVRTVRYSPDGSLLASAGTDRTIRLWDADTGEQLAIEPAGVQAWKMQFALSGQLVGCCYRDGVFIWKVHRSPDDFRLRLVNYLPFEESMDFAMSEDGTTLLARCAGQGVLLFDLTQEVPQPRNILTESGMIYGTMSYDVNTERFYFQQQGGGNVVSCDREGRIRIPPDQIKIDQHELAYSLDGRWLAAREQIVDLKNNRQLLRLPHEYHHLTRPAWSPDGSRLAAGTQDGMVVIWNLEEVRSQLSAFGLEVDSTLREDPSERLPSYEEPQWLAQARDHEQARREGRTEQELYDSAIQKMSAGLPRDAAQDANELLSRIPMTERLKPHRGWRCEQIARYGALFHELVKLRPLDPDLWYARTDVLIEHYNWKQAHAAFLQIPPQDYERLGSEKLQKLAVLMLLAEDREGFEKLFEWLKSRLSPLSNRHDAFVLTRLAGLTEEPIVENVQLLEWSEKLHGENAWHLFAMALGFLRNENIDQAIRCAELSNEEDWHDAAKAHNDLVIALAEHRRGHDYEARTALESARSRIGADRSAERVKLLVHMQDLLSVETLLRETERKIEGANQALEAVRN